MNKVIEVASKEVGTTEIPANSNKNKYGKWFGLDGVAWCGQFVSYCYFQAKKPLPKIGFSKGFAGCQTAAAYFKEHGMLTKTPVAGDIVLFDWNADGRYDHTGLFIEWIEPNKFATIEGNTSLTNQSNGGQVMKRVRFNKNVLFAHIP